MSRRSRRHIPILVRAAALLVVPAVRLVQRLEVTGRENIPSSGPVIFAPNHTNHLDGPTLAVAIYRCGIAPRFIAKSELFFFPLGAILSALGQVKVDRFAPGGVLEQVAESLDAGRSIIIFPEGTFTNDPDLWPMRPKTGIARLAQMRPDVPIVPVAHFGNEGIIDAKTGAISFSRLLRRGRTLVEFGPPITLEGEDARAQADGLMAAIAQRVARLRRRLGEDDARAPETLFSPDVPYFVERKRRREERRRSR